jgi:hypothetical protein
MEDLQQDSFLKFCFQKNKGFIIISLVLGLVYFIVLRLIYPIPSFYSDSFTWVGAAGSGQPVSFRPIGYSKIIRFFHLFTQGDFALIFAQYFSNLLINLFLFLTVTWFFPLKKSLQWLLFVVLIINPFYLFYSNYVSSDAFFCCLTVLWFTLLIWILKKPSWLFIVIQLLVLAGLFTLRYNAIFFPVITACAILITRLSPAKKLIAIAINVIVVAAIITITTYATKKFTGTKTFSAFSGWQLANDALHVMQHKKIDTAGIKDKEVKAFIQFTEHFFDTARQTFPDSSASAVFMWHINSPLKRYMFAYPKRNKSYFKTWNALGPVYNKFGKEIILQNPASYLQYFAIRNSKAYFFPPLEIYETYMEGRQVLPDVIKKYYRYKTTQTPKHYPGVYAATFEPQKMLFIAFNFIFLSGILCYIFSKRFKLNSVLFNQSLLCFCLLYFANFFFIVLLAPSVFRYHIFILTLGLPIIIYLLQQMLKPLPAYDRNNI